MKEDIEEGYCYHGLLDGLCSECLEGQRESLRIGSERLKKDLEKYVKSFNQAENRIRELERRIHLMIAMCGNPDAKQGCRNVIAEGKEALGDSYPTRPR